jgi:hypothetical protein
MALSDAISRAIWEIDNKHLTNISGVSQASAQAKQKN